MSEPLLSPKEFSHGWSHFCSCVDFGKSTLDAEAIKFMNEVPGRIIFALNILQSKKEISPCPN